MKHFQTARAESDISRFSNKDKKILIYHYIAGHSSSSLMLASSSFFLLLLPSHALQKSNLSAFALLSFSYFCAGHPCHGLFQLRSQLAHCCLSVRQIDQKKSSWCTVFLPQVIRQPNNSNRLYASWVCFVISLSHRAWRKPRSGTNTAFFAE